MAESREIRIEQILGRQLLGGNNRPVGRIEEVRVRPTSKGYVVDDVVIGWSGLLERLDLGARLVFGARLTGVRAARWDQIDLSNPEKPRLTVDIESLVKL